MSIDRNGKTCQQNVKQYTDHYSTMKLNAGPSYVPPVGPTYIYGEKKRKTGRGELLRSAGKYTKCNPNPNMTGMQLITQCII